MISVPNAVLSFTALTAVATVRSASMSRPESVSSSTAMRGSSSASWSISMRFFSPPEKPSFRYRLENSRGTWVSSMAASTVLRNSLSETAASPRASRWAFITMRRYLATVTPGMATGYWKAMKRPERARSSGSASVMSSPSNRIWPSVTSRFGCPMIALASVDLPEPFGPISAWNSPSRTWRSTPLRICLSPAETCRLRISRSAMDLQGFNRGCGEADELGERGALQGRDHAHLHARPQELGGAVLAVGLVRAEHAAGAVVEEAVHRRDRALEREHDLVHRDLLGGAGEDVAPVGAAGRADEGGLLEQRGDPLQVCERERLRLGHGLQADRELTALEAELDEQPDPVLRLGGEDHRPKAYQRGRSWPSAPLRSGWVPVSGDMS